MAEAKEQTEEEEEAQKPSRDFCFQRVTHSLDLLEEGL